MLQQQSSEEQGTAQACTHNNPIPQRGLETCGSCTTQSNCNTHHVLKPPREGLGWGEGSFFLAFTIKKGYACTKHLNDTSHQPANTVFSSVTFTLLWETKYPEPTYGTLEYCPGCSYLLSVQHHHHSKSFQHVVFAKHTQGRFTFLIWLFTAIDISCLPSCLPDFQQQIGASVRQTLHTSRTTTYQSGSRRNRFSMTMPLVV